MVVVERRRLFLPRCGWRIEKEIPTSGKSSRRLLKSRRESFLLVGISLNRTTQIRSSGLKEIPTKRNSRWISLAFSPKLLTTPSLAAAILVVGTPYSNTSILPAVCWACYHSGVGLAPFCLLTWLASLPGTSAISRPSSPAQHRSHRSRFPGSAELAYILAIPAATPAATHIASIVVNPAF